MRYVVEVRTAAGGWLRKRGEHRLHTEARLEAERARAAGGVPRAGCCASSGSRTTVRAGWSIWAAPPRAGAPQDLTTP